MNKAATTSDLSFLYTSFKPYCERNGVKLLRDDLRYIENQLSKIPQIGHRRVMKEYFEKWQEGIKQTGSNALGQNMGRKNANTWLREITQI